MKTWYVHIVGPDGEREIGWADLSAAVAARAVEDQCLGPDEVVVGAGEVRRLSTHAGREMLFHLHVPKCAGSSVNAVLANRFQARTLRMPGVVVARRYFEEHTTAEVEENYDAVVGHLRWGLHRETSRPCYYLSAVRDPVERICSYFNYMHTETTHPFHKRAKRRLADLDDLDEAFFREHPTFWDEWSNRMAKTYWGADEVGDADWDAISAHIVTRMLDGTFVLGSIDRIAGFLRRRGIFSGELPRLNVTDTARASDYRPAKVETLQPRTLALLHRINAIDIRLMPLIDHVNRIRDRAEADAAARTAEEPAAAP